MKHLLQFNRFMVMLVAMLTLSVTNVFAGWTRVTKVADLTAGGTFIIGYEATAKSGVIIPMQNSGTATTAAAGYMYSGTTSSNTGTINMASVTETSAYEVTIAASTSVAGAITIKCGDNYLGNTNTKNNCKLFASEAATTAFGVTIGTNDVCTLKIAANASYHTLQYNSGNPRFAVYGGTQKNVVIYKKDVVKSAVTLASCTNGSVVAKVGETSIDSGAEVESGKTVTLSNNPETGYKLDAYSVYKTGDESTTVEVKDGKFTMPEYAVTISATFVAAKTLISVEITQEPDTTEFWRGQTFNASGLVLTATFSTGNEVVTPTSISGYNMSTVGEQTVTVSFSEGATTKTDTYNINVKAISNTQATAYTVAEILSIVDSKSSALTTDSVYVKGIVISASAIGSYGNSTIDVKDPETDGTKFIEFFRCLDLGNKDFTEDYVGVGDTVIAKGIALLYVPKSGPAKYELNQGCYLVDYKKYSEPKKDISNTPETAYTPAKAIELYNDPSSDLTKKVYVKGVVKKNPTLTSSGDWAGSYYQVEVTAAETDEPSFTYFHMWDVGGAAFTEDIVGMYDTVIAYGKLTKYNSTYEFEGGCQMYENKAVQPKAIVIDDQLENGTIEADKASAKPGETVTLTINPATHYHLVTNSLVVLDANAEEITVTDNKFTMPLTAVLVSAEFEQDTKYTISLDKNDATMGSVRFGNTSDDILEFFEGETPSIVATKAAGYRFVNWTTSDNVTIEDAEADSTTIIVKTADATITANFEEEPSVKVTITLNENGTVTTMPGDYYAGEAFNLPTTAGGGCSKAISFVGWSTKEITEALPTQPEENFFAPGASFTPSQDTTLYAVYAKVTPGGYTKVTAAPADWSGEYLLVYDDKDSVAWTGVDAGQCRVDVKIASNKIATKPASAVTLTAASMEGGYSLRVNGGDNDGKYIYGTSGSNKINFGTTASVNTLSYSNNSVSITSNTSVMRYNSASNSQWFRYFKSSSYVGQQVVQLYKKSADAGTDYKTSCTAAIEVAAPTFSIAAGTYTSTQSVELACNTDNSTIYYTTNGDEPTSASTKYTSAIEVAANMTIKAIAYVGTDNYSEVASASYVILKADNSYWYTWVGSEDVTITDTTIYTDGDINLYLARESTGDVTFSSTNEAVATVDWGTGLLSDYPVLDVKGIAGDATITATIAADDTYAGSVATFVLHVIEHKTVVTMSFPQASYNATLGQAFSAPELTVNPTVSGIVYSSSKESVATVDPTTGAVTLVAMGETTIKATFAGDETHDPADASYVLNVTDPNADVITAADLAATNTTYKEFSDVTKTTGTVYAGKTAKDNSGNIQMNSTNPNGIVSTATVGYLKAVSVKVGSGSNTIQVYGKNTAYTSAAELYNNATKGTLLGTATATGAITLEDGISVSDYKYIGIKSAKNALYLANISISWTPATFYAIALTQTDNGKVVINTDAAAEGETVTLTATPDANFAVASWTGLPEGATVSEDKNTVSFSMPAEALTISATFGQPYVRDLTTQNIGTICLNKAANIDNSEITYYEILNKDADGKNITLQEVTTLEAGMPYIFEPNGATQINLVLTGDEAAAQNNNGLYGWLDDDFKFSSQIDSKDVYFISGGKIKRCGNDCTIKTNRAYVVLDEIGQGGQAVPGRKLIRMGVENTNTPTGIDAILFNAEGTKKMVVNNQIVIIRNGKMFNAQGQLVK